MLTTQPPRLFSNPIEEISFSFVVIYAYIILLGTSFGRVENFGDCRETEVRSFDFR